MPLGLKWEVVTLDLCLGREVQSPFPYDDLELPDTTNPGVSYCSGQILHAKNG